MKSKLAPLSVSFFAIACLLAACSTFSGTKPPTALESRLFTVITNYQPVVVQQTNVLAVWTFHTNEVTQTVTNTQGVTVLQTNVIIVPVTSYQTNNVTVTNLQASYNLTPGPGAAQVQSVAGTVGAIAGTALGAPAIGGLVSTGLGIVFSVWGWLRSKKNYATAANTAQVVETMREFVKRLPNGQTYDTALTQFMQSHQADAGVLQNVMGILENEVSNPDAQFAAQSVIATINGLSATPPISTPPAATVSAAPKA